MGYDRATTPTLDRMADTGIAFENAVASGVPTIASMTAVMTGEHSQASPEIGFNETQREQVTSRPTVAEVLSEAGYTTGALSPNPPASSYFGFEEGFDWFEDFLARDRGVVERAWNRVFQRSIAGGSAATYLRLTRNIVNREEVLRPWEDYYDHILEWRESIEEPYFLWVLLLEPHHPWFPPAEHQEWSSRWDKYRSFRYYWEMLHSDWKPEFDESVRQQLIDLYDDSIRYGDAFLEQLQGDLAGDDPVFIVHADHGEEFGEHGRYGHQPYPSEELTHVPLLIAGVDESRRVQAPVALRELAPTISGIANTPHPFTGRDLLRDELDEHSWVTANVFADDERRIAVRTRERTFLRDDGQVTVVDRGSGERENTSVTADRELPRLFDSHVTNEREKRRLRDGIDRVVSEARL
jgi:arylsulfatase